MLNCPLKEKYYNQKGDLVNECETIMCAWYNREHRKCAILILSELFIEGISLRHTYNSNNNRVINNKHYSKNILYKDKEIDNKTVRYKPIDKK